MSEKRKISTLESGSKLEGYSIVRTLAVGGFGAVYLAREGNTGELVAIKEYFPRNLAARAVDGHVTVQSDLDRDSFAGGLKCFFEEARILAQINHPNVVNVRNFFRANQTVYMIMDFYDGHALDHELSLGNGRLEEKELRRLFAYITAGLRAVHLHKMLHLDIKPANIYLPVGGLPIILDFGAARQFAQKDVSNFAGMYTPGFGAPEQYKNNMAKGPWTDIYALGATMYVCMGGQGIPAANKRLEQDKYEKAANKFKGIYSPELLNLVDSCLILDIHERQSSLATLQKVLLTLPVAGIPKSISQIKKSKGSGLLDSLKNLFWRK